MVFPNNRLVLCDSRYHSHVPRSVLHGRKVHDEQSNAEHDCEGDHNGDRVCLPKDDPQADPSGDETGTSGSAHTGKGPRQRASSAES
jgi:hypothetical protein